MRLFGTRTQPAPRQVSTSTGDGASPHLLPSAEEPLTEMSFIDHLEELRRCLIRGLGGVLVAVIAASFFRRWIIDTLLLGPTYPDFFMYRLFGVDATNIALLNRTITGQFFADWGTVIVVGLIIGSPILIYQIWKFVEPGLYPDEKHGLRFSSAFATFFFMLGIAFGYLVLTPLALQFFANYSISAQIANEFDIMKYFSMVTTWSFGVGLLFELPVVIYFLAKMGVVTPEILRTGRRYALIVILVIAAILTPPDPISQIIVAIPLVALYELSILLASYTIRKRDRRMQEILE